MEQLDCAKFCAYLCLNTSCLRLPAGIWLLASVLSLPLTFARPL